MNAASFSRSTRARAASACTSAASRASIAAADSASMVERIAASRCWRSRAPASERPFSVPSAERAKASRSVAGGLGQLAELAARLVDQLAERRGAEVVASLSSATSSCAVADELGELCGAALGEGCEVLLLGAQGVGDGDQRGALLGEAVLQRAHLVADAAAGGLQPADLAAEILGGDARDVDRFAGGGGEVGGAGRQRGLGLAQLGLGEVGRLGDHVRPGG